jgi:hypothetical protein
LNTKLDQIDAMSQNVQLSSLSVSHDSDFLPVLDEMIEGLREEANANRRRVKLWTRFVIGICATVGLLFATLWITALVTGTLGSFDPGQLFGFFGLFGLIGPAALITLSSRRHKLLASQVAKCDDVRALGPLIGSLNIEGHQVQGAVSEAVTRMLGHLDSNSAEQLTGDQIGMLNYQLRRAATDPLVTGTGAGFIFTIGRRHSAWQDRMHRLLLAITKAAPLFGNSDTVKQLERLTRIQGTAPRRKELGSAAGSALAKLRSRLDGQATEALLLRPAGEASPDALLRPASGPGETSADLLLRSSSENA